MRRPRFQPDLLLMAGVLAAGTWLRAADLAAPPPPPPSRTPEKALTASLPPAPPTTKSPTVVFRELLAMSAADRDRALAARPPEQAHFIRAKIQEYLDMPAAEREGRLRLLELRRHLLPLMHTPPADRAPLLQEIPASDRPAVEDRLREWDRVSAADQREFLEHESSLNYMLRLEATTPAERQNLLKDFPATSRAHLELELEHWRALPGENRRRLADRFHRYFELDDREKTKTLNTLTETERQQIEITLQSFKNLEPEQRRRCIEAFGKLASLSPEERNQFLRNAQRWEAMSPADRSAWRQLVQKQPPLPPMPPGILLMPPLPPGLILAATNTPGPKE